MKKQTLNSPCVEVKKPQVAASHSPPSHLGPMLTKASLHCRLFPMQLPYKQICIMQVSSFYSSITQWSDLRCDAMTMRKKFQMIERTCHHHLPWYSRWHRLKNEWPALPFKMNVPTFKASRTNYLAKWHHIPEDHILKTRGHLQFINMPSYIFLAWNLNIKICAC